VGFEIKCEIAPPVNNRKRFRGDLIEAGNETFVIRDEEKNEFELAYDQLANAAPVYSDALLKYEQQRKALPVVEDDNQAVTGG